MTDSKVTIRDVARRAQVAIGTVSRVLNSDSGVSIERRHRVLLAMSELNFNPSPAARNLRTGRSKVIGLVISDFATTAALSAVSISQELIREKGYSLIVLDSQLDHQVELQNLASLRHLQVDGILWENLSSTSQKLPRSTHGRIPTIVMGRHEIEGFTTVRADLANAARALSKRLCELGHVSAGMVGVGFKDGSRDTSEIAEPLLREILREKGIQLLANDSWYFSSRDECRAKLPTILADLEVRPTALLVASTYLAETLITLRELGLKVPRDVSIACYGDSPMALAWSPAIDVITLEYDVLARLAVPLLFDMLEGSVDSKQDIVQSSRYIMRESVGVAPSVPDGNGVEADERSGQLVLSPPTRAADPR